MQRVKKAHVGYAQQSSFADCIMHYIVQRKGNRCGPAFTYGFQRSQSGPVTDAVLRFAASLIELLATATLAKAMMWYVSYVHRGFSAPTPSKTSRSPPVGDYLLSRSLPGCDLATI
ncbi:MAG: hypothetical protein IPP33_18940 [Flavobacteriales bacterium]|nr:hypothetical protein [Flavobacteriales bacterium]